MKGHFDVTLLDSGGYSDEQFRRAIDGGRIDQLLAVLKVEQKLSQQNLVNDGAASFCLDHCFSGPQALSPYYLNSRGMLNNVLLMTTDADPTYGETTNQFTEAYSVTGTIGGGSSNVAAKRFVADTVDQHQLAVMSGGREGIFFRSRWLWLPYEGVSNDIRSLGVYYSRSSSNIGSSTDRGRIARVRLKDDQGRNVILNKTSRQVLLVEYEFSLFTI